MDLGPFEDPFSLARHPVRFRRQVLARIDQHEPGQPEIDHRPRHLTDIPAVERLGEDDSDSM